MSTVGVDIGGSSVKAVVRDSMGEIIDRHEMAASFTSGRQVVSATLAAFDALSPEGCVAVGIGIPGQVDPLRGNVSMAVNLGIGTDPYPVTSQISDKLGVPVFLENDVRAAAIGTYESFLADSNPVASLAFVSIGTGISAGVVVDGTLLRGARGLAGEIGHVVIDEDGPVCRCGQRGCLEALASGPAIGRAWPRGSDSNAATALFSAASNGDHAAGKVASRISSYLITALIWLAATYDTELIVIGGGVANAGDGFLSALRGEIGRLGANSELAARRLTPDQVVLAHPDDLPGPRGAALIAATRSLDKAGPARTNSKTQMSKQQGGTV